MWKSTVVFATLAISSPALADCNIDVEHRRLPLLLNEREGIWFDLEVANCIANDLERLQELELQVNLYEEQRGNLNTQLQLRRTEVHMLQSENRVLKMRYEQELKRRKKLERWTRSPWLHLSIGIAVGATAVALATTL